jgi:acetylornithine/N-succinyldiaminopimelate aminotransferase
VTLPGEAFVMPTYARYPVTLVRGRGSLAWDEDGREYLDFTGGLGVLVLGHCHPVWVEAVSRAADTIGLVSNLYATPPQAELAARLASVLPVPDARVFFCNSGAEANEAAIKLVRKWGLPRGRSTIVALDGSFHGRTVATLAATGQPAKRAAFEPLVDWFRHIPPADVGALAAALDAGDVAAVLLEPVMGEGGVRPLPDDYLRSARELCDRAGALLVADEVQSGMGRCGDWAAVSHAGVEPDVVTLSKALGGGLPIGAMVAGAPIAFESGDHASTFGGGPVPSAAALAVVETIEKEGLLERAVEIGGRLGGGIRASAPAGSVTEIRGRGCLLGFDVGARDAHAVTLDLLARGVLASTAGPSIVRMSPPLVASDDDCDRAVEALVSALGSEAGP